jgi:hypothetical protein
VRFPVHDFWCLCVLGSVVMMIEHVGYVLKK